MITAGGDKITMGNIWDTWDTHPGRRGSIAKGGAGAAAFRGTVAAAAGGLGSAAAGGPCAGFAAVSGVARVAVAGTSTVTLLAELEAQVQQGWVTDGQRTTRSWSRSWLETRQQTVSG